LSWNTTVRFLQQKSYAVLIPDKFFMGKPSQNYGVPQKFTCSPT